MDWRKNLLKTPIIGDITKRIVSRQVDREAKSIANHFTDFLQPQVATTPLLRDEVFKIRHDVYCEELAFEEIKPEGKEQDEFDDQSIFSMIKHKPTNTYTSCVRIVYI
ncbi:MAG: hypothetical protein HRT38_18030 [Alteromonadaceae bacterium]|nr:hypothetical protein [Alteromonadaceae bacterium]